MRFFSTIWAIVFLFNACFSNTSFPINPRAPFYQVTIKENNIRKVEIEASIPLLRDTLWMSQTDFAPLTNGFATFVHDLEATDSIGNVVALMSIGKGIWKISSPLPPVIHLKYYVDIRHDTVQWKVSGCFARAYVADNVLFFTGRSLFIAAKSLDTSRTTIHFNLPGQWQVVTPYADSNSNTFNAKNLSQLWGNGNFAGRFINEEIDVGRLKVILAGTFSMKEGIALFKSSLTKIVNTYAKDMGGAPGGKLVIMSSVSPLSYGGETFSNSISLMFGQPPGLNNKSQWGYLLSHEVFHLWNGGAITAVNQSKVEWFVEGFTDYMSKITNLRTGFITEEEFLEQIANSYDSYINAAGNVSMVNAGEEKGANYSLIYSGGMSAAVALDIECLMVTSGKKGFLEIMKEMYAKFGATNTPYTYENVMQVIGQIAGTDFSAFFSDYIDGTKIIPLKKYLLKAGLILKSVDGRSTIEYNPNSSPAEKKLLGAFLRK